MIHFRVIISLLLIIPVHSYANKLSFVGCRGGGHGHFGFHVNGHKNSSANTVKKNMYFGTIRNQFGEVTFNWFGIKNKKIDMVAFKRGIVRYESGIKNSEIDTLTYQNETCDVKTSKYNKRRIGNCLKSEEAPISSYVRYDKKTKNVKYLTEYQLQERISVTEGEKDMMGKIIENYPLINSDFKVHYFKDFDLKVVESYKLDLSGSKYFNILVEREVLIKKGKSSRKRIVGFKAIFLKRDGLVKLVATTAMDPISGYTDNIDLLGGDFCNRSPNVTNLKITSSIDLNNDEVADIVFLGIEELNRDQKIQLNSAYEITSDFKIHFFEEGIGQGSSFSLFATPEEILKSKKNKKGQL